MCWFGIFFFLFSGRYRVGLAELVDVNSLTCIAFFVRIALQGRPNRFMWRVSMCLSSVTG